MSDKICKIGETTVRVAIVKEGIEANGKHVDTQIVFFVNRDKAVCHFYNTTQLILVNGHGYMSLVEEFLGKYFESKIANNIQEITKFNDLALEPLGKVRRSSVKYKGGSTFACGRCDFAAKTVAALGKHKKSQHNLNITSSSCSSYLAIPKHSTRNNSFTECLMQEDMTTTNISQEEIKATENKKKKLKYTCLECSYKTKVKSHMDEHVKTLHGQNPTQEIKFNCGSCKHEFCEEENYNKHVKTHDEVKEANKSTSQGKENARNLLDDTHDDVIKPTLEEVSQNPPSVIVEDVASKLSVNIIIEEPPKVKLVNKNYACVTCPFCNLESKDLAGLKTHIKNIHSNTDEQHYTCNEIIVQGSEFCFKCTHCDKFGSKLELEKHIKSKHMRHNSSEPFPCNRCGLVLVSFSLLQEHSQKFHMSTQSIQSCVQSESGLCIDT